MLSFRLKLSCCGPCVTMLVLWPPAQPYGPSSMGKRQAVLHD
jgi:hypothetical protein